MDIVFDHPDTVAQWIEQKHGDLVVIRPCCVWGVVDGDGVLRGAFVIQSRHETTAELSVYGRTSNDTFKAMFRTVFGALGMWRLEIRTRRENDTIKRAAQKFGFRWQGVERDFYGPGDDALVWFMRPGDCRWIEDHGITVQVA